MMRCLGVLVPKRKSFPAMNEEQKARLQEVRDDAERACRLEDDENEKKILRAKVDTLEAVAYVFGVELAQFEMFPTERG